MMSDSLVSKLWEDRTSWSKNPDGQRLGQYLCNKYHITDSKIFYEENTEVAFRLFYNLMIGTHK